jgi:hypothetical protein
MKWNICSVNNLLHFKIKLKQVGSLNVQVYTYVIEAYRV